jgi:hypothetical protein
MSGPRKPIVPEATQELQASQVLDVLEGLPVASRPRVRRPLGSQSSIAPVGLDLAAGRDSVYEDEDIQVTAGVVVRPRRNLGKVVIGAVAACALILVAAGVTRVSQASSEPSSPAKAGTPTTEQPTATTATPAPQTPPHAVTSPSPSPGTVGVRAPDSSSTGTVRLDRPAAPGKVWIDGKKISATSVLLTCGTHQIKVGHGRKHSIDVPCGGEIAITK